jgi:hypothetical protein
VLWRSLAGRSIFSLITASDRRTLEAFWKRVGLGDGNMAASMSIEEFLDAQVLIPASSHGLVLLRRALALGTIAAL